MIHNFVIIFATIFAPKIIIARHQALLDQSFDFGLGYCLMVHPTDTHFLASYDWLTILSSKSSYQFDISIIFIQLLFDLFICPFCHLGKTPRLSVSNFIISMCCRPHLPVFYIYTSHNILLFWKLMLLVKYWSCLKLLNSPTL